MEVWVGVGEDFILVPCHALHTNLSKGNTHFWLGCVGLKNRSPLWLTTQQGQCRKMGVVPRALSKGGCRQREDEAD